MAPFRLSIRWHLVLLASLVLIPQVMLGMYVAYGYARDARTAVDRSTQTLADGLIQSADREVVAITSALKVLAVAPALGQGDFQGFYEQAAPAFATSPVRGVAVRDEHGLQKLNTNAPWGAPLPVANATALAFDRELFSSHLPGVSILHGGQVSRTPLVLVGLPVFQDGWPAYTLSAGITPDVISRALNVHSLPEDWLYVVLDRTGHVIARSRDQARYLGAPASDDFMSRATSDAGQIESITLDGVPVSTTFRRSALSGWMVLVSVPRPVLEGPVRSLWRSLIALGAFGILSSGLAAFLYSRVIGGNLLSLSASASRSGLGEMPPPVDSSVAEINDVHQALAAASAELAKRTAHQTILMAELDHRVKNTLAIIQSLAGRTLRSARSAEDGAASLRGRIMALARAHELLSDARWEPVDLAELVKAVSQSDGVAVLADGPPILLAPKSVVALAQTFHELASNGARHGELSQTRAARLTWRVADGSIFLRWREPATAAAPETGSGFGSQVIRLCIERQLGGHARFEVEGDELVFEASIPIDHSVLGNMAILPLIAEA